MNTKYTLLCQPGKILSPGLHMFVLGEWVNPAGWIVLCHGLLSHAETQSIIKRGSVRVYNDNPIYWTGVYHSKGGSRWMTYETKYIGELLQIGYNSNIYIGSVDFRRSRGGGL